MVDVSLEDRGHRHRGDRQDVRGRGDAAPDAAYRLLASHAAVVRNDAPMIAGLRYKDRYRRTSGGWRFQDRLMSYMYYMDVRDCAGALGDFLA
jgi:hypothetical protein